MTTISYVLAIIAALAPSSSALYLLQRRFFDTKQYKSSTEVIREVKYYTLIISTTELLLVLASLAMRLTVHTPILISALQLFIIDSVLLAIPLLSITHEPHTTPRHLVHNASYALLGRRTLARIATWSLVTAVICAANYLLFFARHHLDPRYLDPGLPLSQQAMKLALVTLFGCLITTILFERAHTHEIFFANQLKLARSFVLSLALLLTLLAFTLNLSVLDWLTILLSVSLYAGSHLLQRHTRRHTRQSILQLVDELSHSIR